MTGSGDLRASEADTIIVHISRTLLPKRWSLNRPALCFCTEGCHHMVELWAATARDTFWHFFTLILIQYSLSHPLAFSNYTKRAYSAPWVFTFVCLGSLCPHLELIQQFLRVVIFFACAIKKKKRKKKKRVCNLISVWSIIFTTCGSLLCVLRHRDLRLLKMQRCDLWLVKTFGGAKQSHPSTTVRTREPKNVSRQKSDFCKRNHLLFVLSYFMLRFHTCIQRN